MAVTAGLAENNGSLPPGGWLKGHLRADCRARRYVTSNGGGILPLPYLVNGDVIASGAALEVASADVDAARQQRHDDGSLGVSSSLGNGRVQQRHARLVA